MRINRIVNADGRINIKEIKNNFNNNHNLSFNLLYHKTKKESIYHPFILVSDSKLIDKIIDKEYNNTINLISLQKSKFNPRLHLNKKILEKLHISKTNSSIEIMVRGDKQYKTSFMEIWNTVNYNYCEKESYVNARNMTAVYGL
jgi:hypothetical protein